MKIQPLKIIKEPNYPQKDDVCAAELKTSIPKRWVTCSAAKIALGTLAVMSLVGCKANGDKMPHAASTEQTAEADSTQPTQLIDDFVTMGEPMVPAICVAPIFVHGNGRGALGCVMVTPPVFITEDEALVVINEVAEEYGLEFSSKDRVTFLGVLLPTTNIYEPEEKEPWNSETKITFDFADNHNAIAIEFVSVEDVKKWSKYKKSGILDRYYTKDAAEQLVQGLKSAMPDTYEDFFAGVLYDPCDISEQGHETLYLKLQVKDFFEWLKGEGII